MSARCPAFGLDCKYFPQVVDGALCTSLSIHASQKRVVAEHVAQGIHFLNLVQNNAASVQCIEDLSTYLASELFDIFPWLIRGLSEWPLPLRCVCCSNQSPVGCDDFALL